MIRALGEAIIIILVQICAQLKVSSMSVMSRVVRTAWTFDADKSETDGFTM